MSAVEFIHWLAFRKFSPSLRDRLNWLAANICQAIVTFSINRPTEPPTLKDFLLEFDPEVLAEKLKEIKVERQEAQSLDQMIAMAENITLRLGGEDRR